MKERPTLDGMARGWATPKTLTGGANSKRKERGAGGPDLQEQTRAWPTPAARDYKGANSQEHVTTNGSGRMHMDQLPNFVAHGFHSSPQGQAIQNGLTSSQRHRTLNPRFVEWLMGWPIGWTSFAYAETEFSHWQQRSRGALSMLCTERRNEQADLFGEAL